jgi:hypothetical protein
VQQEGEAISYQGPLYVWLSPLKNKTYKVIHAGEMLPTDISQKFKDIQQYEPFGLKLDQPIFHSQIIENALDFLAQKSKPKFYLGRILKPTFIIHLSADYDKSFEPVIKKSLVFISKGFKINFID